MLQGYGLVTMMVSIVLCDLCINSVVASYKHLYVCLINTLAGYD